MSATVSRVQRRTLIVLAAATILGGLGIGAAFSVGALLVDQVSGNAAVSGLAATAAQLGAALAGIPLARLAVHAGRRPALAFGSLISMLGGILVIASAALWNTTGVLIGLIMLGAATAVQLQSRFAAADLAQPRHRSRDLSLVVWSITVGAVVGPNLIVFDSAIGSWLGVPRFAGVFVFAVLAQFAAAVALWSGLRPDPLFEARRSAPRDTPRESAVGRAKRRVLRVVTGRSAAVRVTIVLSLGQAVMVALMAMTPLHLKAHDASDLVVGFTLSLHIAGMYALSPVFGVLTGRIGAVPVVLVGAALFIGAAAVAWVAGDNDLKIQVAMTLLGLGWSAVNVAGSELLLEVAEPATLTRSQGIADTSLSAAGALGGAAAGLGFAVGGLPLLGIIAGILVIILAVLTVSVVDRRVVGATP